MQIVRPGPFMSDTGQKMGRGSAHLAGARSGVTHCVRTGHFVAGIGLDLVDVGHAAN
jgi:hypothetical protein